MECGVVQGNEQCLRVAWQTLDKQSWPEETPRNNNFEPIEGGRYGITKDDVQLKPGQPLALQLEALHHFLTARTHYPRGKRRALKETTWEADFASKLRGFAGFLRRNASI